MDISSIKLKYIFLLLFIVAPNGSRTPVLTPVSLAIDLIIAGLNWGSENIHFTFFSPMTSLISDNC